MSLETLWSKARPYLGPLGRGYAWLMRLRQRAYSQGLFRCFALPVPVISIGNLTLGGEGKTPVTLSLARGLYQRGKKVAVLSRGYKAKVSAPLVASRGQGPLAGPEVIGDEAYLLASKLPVPVVVGRQRVAAGALAVREFQPDLLLLDDGFQHLRLFRDIDLVLFAADHPGVLKEPVFPAGRLREPKEALGRASAFLITKTNIYPKGAAQLFVELRTYARPIFEIPFSSAGMVSLRHWPQGPFENPSGKALAFCGLAKADSFWKVLRETGVELVATKKFPDHHLYRKKDLEELLALKTQCQAQFLVTTEKDAVKLRAYLHELPNCYVLVLEPQIPQNLWDFLEDQLTQQTHP